MCFMCDNVKVDNRSISVETDYVRQFNKPGELDKLAQDAQSILKDVDYDTLVTTDMSGILLVPSIARTLGKNWVIVREMGDDAQRPIIGTLGHKWIFADEYVTAGRKRSWCDKVISDIAREENFRTIRVGTYEISPWRDKRLKGFYYPKSDDFRRLDVLYDEMTRNGLKV